MAIGLLFSRPLFQKGGWLALAFVLLALRCVADDQVKLKSGVVISGQILEVSDGLVLVSSHSASGSVIKLPYHLSDVDTITMAAPDAVVKARGGSPADAVAVLEPQIKQFAGLPADWVVDAMGQLADAYAALGKGDQASATYDRIDTLYPGSKYHLKAVAGKAQLSLQQGKIDEALAALQPIIDQANKDIAPSLSDGGLYASAFLVEGEALEAQKKLPAALEAYLTVKTMFYQNPTLADQADQLAKKLRDQNPGLGID